VYSVNCAEVTRRAELLTTYINRHPDLELQALYAVQAFVHQLQHPRGQYSVITAHSQSHLCRLSPAFVAVEISVAWLLAS